MMSIRLSITSALLGGAALLCSQENPPAPPKTGSVAGTVIDEKSGEGIPKALITLRRDPEGGLGQITDSNGKFSLHDVEPGTYTLSVERDRYVLARGQTQTIDVQPGQATSDIKLKLQRTGVVSGRILDADGEPVSGVNVVVSPSRPAKGVLRRSWNAITNDRGEYRIFDIAPGEYRVSATYAPGTRDNGLHMQRRAGAAADPAGEAYPTVYYPAALDVRQSTAVAVAPGAELHGFDLQLVRASGVRVRGRIMPSGGGTPPPVFQMVTLVPVNRQDAPLRGARSPRPRREGRVRVLGRDAGHVSSTVGDRWPQRVGSYVGPANFERGRYGSGGHRADGNAAGHPQWTSPCAGRP